MAVPPATASRHASAGRVDCRPRNRSSFPFRIACHTPASPSETIHRPGSDTRSSAASNPPPGEVNHPSPPPLPKVSHLPGAAPPPPRNPHPLARPLVDHVPPRSGPSPLDLRHPPSTPPTFPDPPCTPPPGRSRPSPPLVDQGSAEVPHLGWRRTGALARRCGPPRPDPTRRSPRRGVIPFGDDVDFDTVRRHRQP